MVDRAITKQSSAVKPGASAADMAVRPFQCDWHEGCPKSFNRKSDLQRHYRIHTNERPYACDYKPCNKTFIQRSALTVHRRTHTGDKPHKCPFGGCGKCFSDSSSLARHRRIHTNDKPYICRNQRCKKAFCRKTTMTKHIRKEHPTEPAQEDHDVEYSDDDVSEEEEEMEEDTEETKEGSHHRYQEPVDLDQRHQSVGAPSTYDRNLWRLPGETVQRPSPLQLQRPIPRSEPPIHEIKLERSCSSTPQRSLTDPYPSAPMHGSDYSHVRADTMPIDLPQAPASVPPQYQLRDNSNASLWSSQSLQDSPTSLTHSSPSSAATRLHPLFPSQTYQMQHVSIPEPMSYSDHQETVHNMGQLKLEQSQMRAYGGLPQSVPQQDAYTSMSREASQHRGYDGNQAQSVAQIYQNDLPPTPASTQSIQIYQNDLPPTPASTQSMPQYTAPIPGVPYQPPLFLPPDNLPIGNQFFSPHVNGIYQYNDGMDWWKEEVKPEDYWSLMPSQRMSDWL